MQTPHRSKIERRIIQLLTGLMIVIGGVPLMAQVPEYISFQGPVSDAEGNPLTGYHSIAIRIYADSGEVYSGLDKLVAERRALIADQQAEIDWMRLAMKRARIE